MEQLDSCLLNSSTLNSKVACLKSTQSAAGIGHFIHFPLFAVSRGKTILERVESAHFFLLIKFSLLFSNLSLTEIAREIFD